MNDRQFEILGEAADEAVKELREVIDMVEKYIGRNEWDKAIKSFREDLPGHVEAVIEIIDLEGE